MHVAVERSGALGISCLLLINEGCEFQSHPVPAPLHLGMGWGHPGSHWDIPQECVKGQ